MLQVRRKQFGWRTSMWSCSRSKPPDIIDDMTNQEAEPDDRREQYGQPLARTVVLRVASILPEVPIRGENPHADGDGMLLELEEALRLPEAGLLDRDPDVDAKLGVDPCPHDEGEDPENTYRRGIAGRRHRAEAIHEIA